MESSIEQRTGKILKLMESLYVTIPPEVRRLIEGVFAGQMDVSPSLAEQKELAHTIRTLTKLFDASRFEDFDDRTMFLALSWWTMVNRQAKAIAALVQDGLEAESIPNDRVAFEYAMALVTLSKGDPDEILIALIAQVIKDLTRIHTGSTPDNAEFRQAVDVAKAELDAIEVGRWLTGFTRRANELHVDERARYYYGIFSLFVHPTILSTMSFVDLSKETPMSKEPNQVFRTLVGNPLLWAVQCLCWSALALDHLLEGRLAWRDELVEVIHRYQVPYASTLFTTPS